MNITVGRTETAEVFNALSKLGCCNLCCLRLIGETSAAGYKDVTHNLKKRGIITESDEEQCSKIQKMNPCIACLGLLEKPTSDLIMEKVSEEIVKADYDCDTFNFAITLPVAFQLRAHSLWLYLEKNFESFTKAAFQHDCVTVGVKDVWKWLYQPLVEEKTRKGFDLNSDFFIGIIVSYKENDDECSCLYKMLPSLFKNKKSRRQQAVQETFSRKGVEQAFRDIRPNLFLKHFPSPPNDATSAVFCEKTTLQHNSIFIAGRYNKWSRELPQTPWILAGERKLESSVQELISDPLLEFTKAESGKFAASGREDVDVRTLGRGRPFAVELLNPRRIKLSSEILGSLQMNINKTARGKVSVRHLQLVNKDSLTQLKCGEEEKTKEYTALCVVRGRLPKGLMEVGSKCPVVLEQKTPIRVLHRRPVATRQRTVHWIKPKPVSDSESEEGPSYFTLTMSTQAGTYIKEFIHGDFRRTQPSLGDILGGVSVDIVALDVQDIVLDWPPEIEDPPGEIRDEQ